MNKIENTQKPEPYKYYVKKPTSTRDIIFLEAVNRLMVVWDTCHSNHLDKLVEILQEIRDNQHKCKFDCNDLIEIFKSYKTNFIGKNHWFDNKPIDYNNSLIFLVWLLSGECRYKMVKEMLPYAANQNFLLGVLVTNEFATLQDIRDAFKAGIDINKNCVSAFKNVLCKEYGEADQAKRIYLNGLIYDIVFCIEHSSYMDNTQLVHSMYKQFNIPGTQVKKAEFMTGGESIVQQDSRNIIASLTKQLQVYGR